MEKTREDKIADIVEELAKDKQVIELVQGIEKRIETTKGRYGDYMGALSHFNRDISTLKIMARVFKKAGANSYGVDWAVKLLTGSEG